MLPILSSFSVGLLVMLISAHVFLNVAKDISAKWKFSPLFISLVIVALGTNLPELTVTIASLSNSDPGLAMGNVVGSSIANLTIILGVSTLFGSVRVGTTKTPKNTLILILITVLFSVLMLSSVRVFYQVALLILALIFALMYQYKLAKYGRLHEDRKLLELLDKLHRKKKYLPKYAYFLLFFGSLIGLAIGGQITVTAVETLADLLVISTTLLGLSLTAIATSLPELLMAIIASNKEDNKVVLGTLIGSNIFNLTLFPAIVLFSTIGYKIRKFISIKEIFFLLLITVTFYFVVQRNLGKNISKKTSLVLITLFPIFMYFVFYL